MEQMKHRKGEARARAFAVAAIRETYEEAGVFIGQKGEAQWKPNAEFAPFASRGISLDLKPFRFIARAITPPRRPRRFDTRFLAVWADAICDRLPEGTGPTGELEELCWLSLEEAKSLELPAITLTIIEELQKRLADDPELDPATPVPLLLLAAQGLRARRGVKTAGPVQEILRNGGKRPLTHAPLSCSQPAVVIPDAMRHVSDVSQIRDLPSVPAARGPGS